jgi:elongation factor Ts
MAEIDAVTVKALREKTGQSMMECKKALVEAKGDMEAAVDLLRKKGLSEAGKKAARTAKEGLIGIFSSPGSATMVEVVCETDFCARNEEFRRMVKRVAELAAAAAPGAVEATPEMLAAVGACFSKIGENMKYVRGVKLAADKLGAYIHHNGVLLGVEGDLPDQTLSELCMHIAFADPVAVRTDQVPAELVERERRIAVEQAKDTGKPAPVQEKIVQGKVAKYLASAALLEQPFVKDEKKKVKDILGPAKVTAFARFQVGA